MTFSHIIGLQSEAVADGKIHRYGKKKNKWYVFYGKFGIAGDWSTGDKIEWKEDNAEFTYTDRQAIKKSQEENQARQLALWEARSKKTNSELLLWKSSGDHSYLSKKKIGLNGAYIHNNKIIVPIHDAEGKIWSYQSIDENGVKNFPYGTKKKGNFFIIGNPTSDDLVVVCEGFATGASIHQATGKPVVVAFDAGNLKPVCDALPFTNILIAADNDVTGIKYASESGYKYVVPVLGGEDFSDVFLRNEKINIENNTNKIEIQAHGLVGEIAKWILETAIRPQPELALGAAISFVALLKGHKFETRTGLRTNLLILNIAPTGSGKEHPQSCVRKLMKQTGLQKHLLGLPASGSGFLTGLRNAGAKGLLISDEAGRYLESLNGKDASGYQREISTYMIQTFSCANSILIAKQYADEKSNPRNDIENPHFCFLGSSVKERIVSACSNTNAIDGFLNRFLIFEEEKRVKKQHNNYNAEIPSELLDKIKNFLYEESMTDKVVPFTKLAYDEFIDFDTLTEEKQDKAGYPLDAIYVRSSELVAKLALIFSDNIEITVQDVKLAINIYNKTLEKQLQLVNNIADNETERNLNKIYEFINKRKLVSLQEITNNTRWLQGRERKDILQSLETSERIVAQMHGKKLFYKVI